VKARVDQKALAEAARWSSRHLDQKPAMPVLACLLLEADGTALTVSGFDHDTSTRTVLDADVLEPGSALVSGRMLADVTAALSTGPVDVVGDDQQLTVTTPGTRFGLPVAERRDYPSLPTAPAVTGTVDGAVFADAVAAVVPAVMPQKDAVGPVAGMGGIRVTAAGEQLKVAATNRYLIVERTIGWEPAGQADGVMLLPEPVLAAAARGFAGSNRLGLAFPQQGGVAGLCDTDSTLTARLLDADYPDLDRFHLSTDTSTGYLDVDPGALAAAAKRMSLVNEAGRPVRLTVGGQQLQVAAGHDGRSGTTVLDAECVGDTDGFQIAFNPAFLAAAMGPVQGTARIWVWTRIKPVLIQAADADPNYWAVLMPIRLPD
jgi:DNA polymerase-3 subunit beta